MAKGEFDGGMYFAVGTPRVDRAKMQINGMKVATLGEARGHGLIVDEVTLGQFLALGQAAGKLKVRFTHPLQKDGLGTFVGYASNFRRDGDSVIADLQVDPVAAKSPQGDLADYVLSLAESAPDSFGASPVVTPKREQVKGQKLPSLRILSFRAVDLVDEPATNDGLFEAGKGDMPDSMTPAGNSAEDVAKIKEELRAEFKAGVNELKAQFAKDKDEAVALAAKTAAEKALADERTRQADILALCQKAKSPELADGFLKEGLSKSQVQEKLFLALCEKNPPVGDGGSGTGGKEQPENAKYLAEYEANKAAYLKAKITKDDYVASRRIDDELDPLMPKALAEALAL